MGSLQDVGKAAALPPEAQPPANSTDLVLEAANEVEYVQTWYLNEEEWKGPLTLEEYTQREQLLIEQDLTRNTITAWILTSPKLPSSPDGGRAILASCETLLKPAFVARNGKVEKILAHGIASVYAQHEYRGKGYATRMMTELGKKLDNWQQEAGTRGTFSVLFSDIGPKFYNRLGWQPFPSTHISLQPIDEATYEGMKKGSIQVHDLMTEDLPTLPTVAYAEERLRALSSAKPNVPFVAVQPDFAHFRWHQVREEFQASTLGLQFPRAKGAIHKESGVALIWCRVYATDRSTWQLDILHTVIPPTAVKDPNLVPILQALLLRAQLEAHNSEMPVGVEVWDPSEAIISAAQGLRSKEDEEITITHRDKEHICSLKWIGGRDEDVETFPIWALNEKYAWC